VSLAMMVGATHPRLGPDTPVAPIGCAIPVAFDQTQAQADFLV